MKWRLLPVSALLCLSTSMQTMGQEPGKLNAFAYQEGNNSFTSNVMLNEISPRAFRHFKRNYPMVIREQWAKSRAGFSVSFSDPDSTCFMIHYDAKGRYQNTLMYYRRMHMPIYIGRVVKYLYEDYDVSFVAGMNDGIRTTFDVALVKKKMVKTVEISGEGEVTMINQYENEVNAK
ncbi:MAG: hypothetical protein Q8927_06300 [Bacteroidota bacterium]|nr:hypothetical protein [Bacteroidota bacterium]MDP4215794.1 hypothetical protein [Bacteroidota bacterium]MDP4245307.1 hypothetical protein [Bacteroidota bacterium]MDP4255028.1 hypothetical protein [Bacteroidota bacterium]MDP4257647.1 hypothetical protein [Bacteroidota bacterium]